MAETVPFHSGSEKSTQGHEPESRVYTNEEVSEVIRVALRAAEQHGADTVCREDMLAIGKDFGLTPGQFVALSFVVAAVTIWLRRPKDLYGFGAKAAPPPPEPAGGG